MIRLVGAVLTASLAVGCGSAPPESPAGAGAPATTGDVAAGAAPTPTSPSPTPRPTPSVSPTAEPPPAAEPYRPGDGEVHPGAKQVAAEVAQALTTYDPGADAATVAGEVAVDRDERPDLVATIEPLIEPEHWSRGSVIYPQLGGVGEDGISVMVLLEQALGTGAEPDRTVTRTLDVRLERIEDGWVLDRVASIGGEPVDRPDDLSAIAQEILDDDRIGLPDSARWDIHRGIVAPALLEVMRVLADRAPYEVVSLSSGHPFHVFGTDRLSNHTRGRAVDIHRIDGVQVIGDRDDGSTTHAVVRWLYDLPQVSEIGSPWALDGYGGRSFSDIVHQDHLHIGVRPNAR